MGRDSSSDSIENIHCIDWWTLPGPSQAPHSPTIECIYKRCSLKEGFPPSGTRPLLVATINQCESTQHQVQELLFSYNHQAIKPTHKTLILPQQRNITDYLLHEQRLVFLNVFYTNCLLFFASYFLKQICFSVFSESMCPCCCCKISIVLYLTINVHIRINST